VGTRELIVRIFNSTHQSSVSNSESGWTFVETIIVVAIILALTSTVAVAGIRYVEKARRTSAISEISALSLALDGYYLDCGAYPTTEQGIESLWALPQQSPVPKGWAGPYLNKKDFVDPWGKPYRYENPGPHNLAFALISYGADGTEGGEGNDADIVSWEAD